MAATPLPFFHAESIRTSATTIQGRSVQSEGRRLRHSNIGCLAVLIVTFVTDNVGASASIVRAQSPAPPCPLTAPYRADNAFARILRGERPASVIAQDRRVMAIIPLDWEHPGHALVIPKSPARHLDDLGDRDALAVLHMVKRVAAAQRGALGSTGYFLQQNNASRQDVCHFHIHVIPDTPAVPRVRATRAEMDAMAERLRAALPPH